MTGEILPGFPGTGKEKGNRLLDGKAGFLFYTEFYAKFYAKTGFYLRYANFGRPFSSGTSTLPCTRGSA